MTDQAPRAERKRPDKLERVRLRSEILKNSLGAAAVIAAGIWGVFLFCQKEYPRLQPKVGGTISIAWQKIAELCIADATLEVRNDGGKFVTVSDVTFKAWNFPNSVFDRKSYFDTKELPGALTVLPLCSSEKPCTLIGSYAPGSNRYETFTWSFAADRSRSIFIEATVTGAGRKFIAGNRSTMCGEAGEIGAIAAPPAGK